MKKFFDVLENTALYLGLFILLSDAVNVRRLFRPMGQGGQPIQRISLAKVSMLVRVLKIRGLGDIVGANPRPF